MEDTPSVVSNYAHIIANGRAVPHACVTTIKAADRRYVGEIVDVLQQYGSYKAVRVSGSLAASLKAFAAGEHKFKSPRGEWTADMSKVAMCSDDAAGCMDAVLEITRVYPLTPVIVADASLVDREFIDLFAKVRTASRLVLVESAG